MSHCGLEENGGVDYEVMEEGVVTWLAIHHSWCAGEDGGGCCVRIKNGSQVQGDVVFKGAEGRVILQSGSVIKGVVLNGKVVQG